jgi:pimeloyl-ACP methyl ester carboxylesterase
MNRTCLALAGIASFVVLAAPTDNFLLPEGTATAQLGELGGVERAGHGPVPMVLLPGAPFGAGIWKEFMQRNAQRYTMLAATPPGYAGTKPPPQPADPTRFEDEPWTRALLDAVVELAEDEGMRRVVVVGHHLMGGYYAVRLGLEHPELFAAAISVFGEPARVLPSAWRFRPARPTLEQQRANVRQHWLPFYRTVDQATWNAFSYQPAQLSRDAAAGARLFEEEVSVPLPIQLRYFCEYVMQNLTPQLEETELPILAVWSTPDETPMIEGAVRAYVGRGLSEVDARAKVDELLAQEFGSAEAGRAALRTTPWSDLAAKNPRIRLTIVPDSAAFMMLDQPAELDRLIAEFVARTAERDGESRSPARAR